MPTLPHPLTDAACCILIEVQPDRPDTSGTAWTQARRPHASGLGQPNTEASRCTEPVANPVLAGTTGQSAAPAKVTEERAQFAMPERRQLTPIVQTCAAEVVPPNVICRAEQLRAVSALELSLGGVRSRRSRGDERAASRLDNYSPSPPSTMRASAAVSVPSLTAAGAPLA